MIVQLNGNVNFPITLDPTVWIFDDRKIELDKVFHTPSDEETDDGKQEVWDRNEYQQQIRPPVNKSISRYERKKVLENSYVMPIRHFIHNAEPSVEATEAVLHTNEGEVTITYQQLLESLLLFALDGKPLRENGPVQVLFGDGSNQDEPIQGVHTITVH
ncbi:hypothetical protein CEY16_01690 [Halalkalibacillus sediminis]|uniref:Peptidyl-prolyl cis-trans isomerase n=1 Tax=Halalkalibacillus sediminis TaxID=2018042 RepID=A0A2I0QVY4_9BACI|nr:hypothetical protein [Halalkalibacillus sediminis]PKR78495.1 hypothetical protein CEY16_01690 [Halalkalibacillus sediminis]